MTLSLVDIPHFQDPHLFSPLLTFFFYCPSLFQKLLAYLKLNLLSKTSAPTSFLLSEAAQISSCPTSFLLRTSESFQFLCVTEENSSSHRRVWIVKPLHLLLSTNQGLKPPNQPLSPLILFVVEKMLSTKLHQDHWVVSMLLAVIYYVLSSVLNFKPMAFMRLSEISGLASLYFVVFQPTTELADNAYKLAAGVHLLCLGAYTSGTGIPQLIGARHAYLVHYWMVYNALGFFESLRRRVSFSPLRFIYTTHSKIANHIQLGP